MFILIYFILYAICIVGCPVLGFLLYNKFKSSTIYKHILLLLALNLFIYFVLVYFNISLKGDIPDAVMYCLTSFAYSSLIVRFYFIKEKLLKYFLLIISLLPYFLGLLLSTIGLLGLLLVLNDYEIYEEKPLTNNIEYRKYMSGNATTSNNFDTYYFFKTCKFSPFEKRIAKIELNHNYYNTDSLKIDFKELDAYYRIKMISKEKVEFDTLIKK